jgi:WD40 repeat protein
MATLGDDLFVSGSDEYSLLVWCNTTLRLDATFRCEGVNFHDIVFEENRLIYRSENRVKIWNMDMNYLEAEFQDESFTCTASCSDFMVFGNSDGSVRVCSVTTGLLVFSFHGHTESVSAVAICGNIIASGSSDKTVRLWKIKENKNCGVLIGHTDSVLSVAFTSNAEKIASSSSDKNVRVWSVEKLQLLLTLSGHNNYISIVRFSKNNQFIVSGAADEVRVWNIIRGELVCCFAKFREAEEWIIKYPEVKWIAERFLS